MSRFTTSWALVTVLVLWSAPARSQPIRLSFMGPPADRAFDAFEPAVAYNPVDEEVLVVWSGYDDRDGQAHQEFEIFIQRVDAVTGDEIGIDDYRISAYGGLGTTAAAVLPDVAYNPDAHEYLVVWATRPTGNTLGPVYGQRIGASTGLQAGLSNGVELSAGAEARSVSVAYNQVTREYLVAWDSYDSPDTATFEHEIFVRRLRGSDIAPLADARRISSMGPDLDPDFDAYGPDVAADSASGFYAVVWKGHDTSEPGNRTFLQLLNRSAEEIGEDDLPLSLQSGIGAARVAHQPLAGAAGEYLAVWDQSVDGVSAVYGRRINALTGRLFAGEPVLLSDLDPEEVSRAYVGAVAARAEAGDWVVAWSGRDPGLAATESEIFATAVSRMGTPSPRVRVSEAGGTGDAQWEVRTPAVADGPSGSAFVAWSGEDDRGGMVDGEFEIFGRTSPFSIFADGFESGSTGAWTAVVGE